MNLRIRRVLSTYGLSMATFLVIYCLYLVGTCVIVYLQELSSETFSDFESTHLITEYGWTTKPNIKAADILVVSGTQYEYCHDSAGFKIPCKSPNDYSNPNKILFTDSPAFCHYVNSL